MELKNNWHERPAMNWGPLTMCLNSLSMVIIDDKSSEGIILKYAKNTVISVIIVLVITFFMGFGLIWSASLLLYPERKLSIASSTPQLFNHKVTSETIVIKDREYLCGDIEKISEEAAPEEIQGLDKLALSGKYQREGWSINFTDPNYLTLTCKPDQFCSIHQSYRHLGAHEGLLAVYEGPLGASGRLLRVENIALEALNPDFRVKLEQAANLRNLDHQTVEKLREDLEFSNDEALCAALDNLDEYVN